MLKIRLQRTGKRGQAYFRVVITEHTTKSKGKYLELLGSYDPHKNKISVDGERVKHWLSMGAHLSKTANNLLIGRGIIKGEKVKAWKPKTTETRKGRETQKGIQEQPTEIKIEASTTEAQPETQKEVKGELKIEKSVPAPAKKSEIQEPAVLKESNTESKPTEAAEEFISITS